MAVFAGPKVNYEDVIFYVDGRSAKLFPGAGVIKSFPTEEEKTSSITVSANGYFISNYKSVEPFSETNLADKTAITASVLIGNTTNKQGTAFTVNSGVSIAYGSDNQNTVYTTSGIETLSTSTDSMADDFADTSLASYNTSEVITLATSEAVDLGIFTQSNQTSYTTSDVSTLATATISEPDTLVASDISLYTTTPVETISDGIYNAMFYPEYEVSLYIKGSSAIAVSRNSQVDNTLSIPISGEKNIISVVYRFSEGIPITGYVNGEFSLNSPNTTVVMQSANYDISVLNNQQTAFSQYDVGLIKIHNKELTSGEILLANNLRGN